MAEEFDIFIQGELAKLGPFLLGFCFLIEWGMGLIFG